MRTSNDAESRPGHLAFSDEPRRFPSTTIVLRRLVFQNDRETGRKGLVVIDLTIGGWT
jgi:hypothetical protein